MKVRSIAECSPWSILQYFWPALSDNWSWKPIFGLFESGCFTQILLYIKWKNICICLFDLMLYIPVINFSVYVKTFPGLNQRKADDKVSCWRTLQSASREVSNQEPLDLESHTLPLSHFDPYIHANYICLTLLIKPCQLYANINGADQAEWICSLVSIFIARLIESLIYFLRARFQDR